MIADNLNKIRTSLPNSVRLVAVSKYHPVEALLEAYNAGQRVFGESLVQECVAKQQALPSDIEWHFIGHLQTNKVKYLAPFVSLIHSVDSPKLLKEINKQAAKCGRTIDCLLQLHVAQEDTKFGFTSQELTDYLNNNEWRDMTNVRIVGLMAMASNTDDMEQVGHEFQNVHQLFNSLKTTVFANDNSFQELSMGMSSDYPVAVEHGSTLVRVGSMIFGNRVY